LGNGGRQCRVSEGIHHDFILVSIKNQHPGGSNLSVTNHAVTEVQLNRPIDQCQDLTAKGAICLYLLGVDELMSLDMGHPSMNCFMHSAVSAKDECEDQGKGADELAQFVDILGGVVFDFRAARHIRIGKPLAFRALKLQGKEVIESGAYGLCPGLETGKDAEGLGVHVVGPCEVTIQDRIHSSQGEADGTLVACPDGQIKVQLGLGNVPKGQEFGIGGNRL
jgi:hypothetical protein